MSRLGNNENSIDEIGEYYPKFHMKLIQLKEEELVVTGCLFSTLEPGDYNTFSTFAALGFYATNDSLLKVREFGGQKAIRYFTISDLDLYNDTGTLDQNGDKIYKYEATYTITYEQLQVTKEELSLSSWSLVAFVNCSFFTLGFSLDEILSGEKNFLSYEKITVEPDSDSVGFTLPSPNQEIYIDNTGLIYKKEVLFSLSAKPYKTDKITSKEILDEVTGTIASLNLTSLEAIFKGNSLIEKITNSNERIIIDLNTAISEIDSVNCSPETLSLIQALEPLPPQFNSTLISSGLLERKKYKKIRVMDLSEVNLLDFFSISADLTTSPVASSRIYARPFPHPTNTARQLGYTGYYSNDRQELINPAQVFYGQFILDYRFLLRTYSKMYRKFNTDVLMNMFGSPIIKMFFRPKRVEVSVKNSITSPDYSLSCTTDFSYPLVSGKRVVQAVNSPDHLTDREYTIQGITYKTEVNLADPEVGNLVVYDEGVLKYKNLSKYDFLFFDYQLVKSGPAYAWPTKTEIKVTFSDQTERIFFKLVKPVVEKLRSDIHEYYEYVVTACNLVPPEQSVDPKAVIEIRNHFSSNPLWIKIPIMIEMLRNLFSKDDDGNVGDLSAYLAFDNVVIKPEALSNVQSNFETNSFAFDKNTIIYSLFLTPEVTTLDRLDSIKTLVEDLCSKILSFEAHIEEDDEVEKTVSLTVTNNNVIYLLDEVDSAVEVEVEEPETGGTSGGGGTIPSAIPGSVDRTREFQVTRDRFGTAEIEEETF